jgi:NAD(P)-dependent dehydrogenase (short-subunit alcohol dehydrogenase family)
MRLRDRVAIVTGGGHGIGRGISLRLAEEGACVVIAEQIPELGLETLAQIEAQGDQARFIPTDVTQRSQVESMVSEVMAEFGSIDILVNNAGLTGRAQSTGAAWC